MQEQNSSQETWPLQSVYFYLTPECNLACRHCWIAPKFQNVRLASQFLPMEIISSVIRQGLPLDLTSIKLTGGEPFLHPNILDILSLAREYSLDVVVETNGTLVTSEIAKSLSQCSKKTISVSLDGIDAATHEWVRGVPGSFERTCEGIRTLTDAGLKPQIIMSLFKRNADQIAPMIRMAERMGAGSVKFNLIQPTERGLQVHASGEALPIAELIRISRWVEQSLAKETRIKLHFCIPAAFKSMGSLFGQDGGGCARCNIQNILGVLADGSYALCGIGESIPEMVFGHAGRDSLDTIWNNHPVIREIRKGLPHRLKGICGQCAMKGVCLGSCLAQNYCRSRDLWAPFWLCEDAKKEGLFPGTRMTGN